MTPEVTTDVKAAEVAGRVAAVRARLHAAGGDRVRLVAAAKGASPALLDAAVAAGVADVGMSTAQWLLAAAAGMRTTPRWHFIGRLQTNKVKVIAHLVDLWQSVDRPRLVDEIARRAPGAHVLVQVDVTGDPAKGGCRPADVPALVARAVGAGLVVEGLMAGPTIVGAGRTPFRLVARLADELGLPERCMGMTDDLEDAVAEGATMVRVGRALFSRGA
jgi:uncharacterized pyridoxal phosphate-containing UPF0001 family protein